uniref:Uncharacterized protein n=1 Tax=Anopheles darlingi TaxID=43151 RepID=A0A2M4DC54_ANODA
MDNFERGILCSWCAFFFVFVLWHGGIYPATTKRWFAVSQYSLATTVGLRTCYPLFAYIFRNACTCLRDQPDNCYFRNSVEKFYP